MKAGLVVPQGWTGEFAGWTPTRAWGRSLEIAQEAEELGFESIWAFDHFTTVPKPTQESTFESFTLLTSIASATSTVRLGHLVACAAFRPASLVAKMAATIDVASGGRFELGLGGGWKADEFVAYGYEFGTARQRLRGLKDALEVITRMLNEELATYEGQQHSVVRAINRPKPIQSRLPIIVGGNGPEITWRLAARYADELNVDDLDPPELAAALPVIHTRCEEIGRDPADLRVSLHYYWPKAVERGRIRRDTLQAYAQLGVHRVMVFLPDAVDDPTSVAAFASDCKAAGVELAT